MYFYVDESGHTGLNLFDKNQPCLYYGVLSSKNNIDILSLQTVKKLRSRMGVERLHASELGNGKLIKLTDDLIRLRKKHSLKFDLFRVMKADYALMAFFDQVFDQGMNPAVPWMAYWTPLRYVLLIKLAHLFDDETLQKAWTARITTNNEKAEKILVSVCQTIKERVFVLPDPRSRELITDALSWTILNPDKISYNERSKKNALQISPNLIGFQVVMHGIAKRLKASKKKATKIIVDRQSQFNRAQEFIADLYRKGRDVEFMSGPGMSVMDLKNIPDIPITCTPGTESVGLELVDIYIWIFKRHMEKKSLAPELLKIIKDQLNRGMTNEVSIKALQERWGDYFQNLPDPSMEEIKKGKELIKIDEERRKIHLSN